MLAQVHQVHFCIIQPLMGQKQMASTMWKTPDLFLSAIISVASLIPYIGHLLDKITHHIFSAAFLIMCTLAVLFPTTILQGCHVLQFPSLFIFLCCDRVTRKQAVFVLFFSSSLSASADLALEPKWRGVEWLYKWMLFPRDIKETRRGWTRTKVRRASWWDGTQKSVRGLDAKKKNARTVTAQELWCNNYMTGHSPCSYISPALSFMSQNC